MDTHNPRFRRLAWSMAQRRILPLGPPTPDDLIRVQAVLGRYNPSQHAQYVAEYNRLILDARTVLGVTRTV